MPRAAYAYALLLLLGRCVPAQTIGVPGSDTAVTSDLHPNLAGQLEKPLRYRPDNGDFVIHNGVEFFNRSLYGGNTAFRVDGGDKAEFLLYLPGRGGNLRLGVRLGGTAKWLKDAANVTTRYRPGELIYTARDPSFGPGVEVRVEVLAYAATEGLIVRAQISGGQAGAELLWAYGGVNGQRGARGGDIGTENVPISQFFQLQPAFAAGNRITLGAGGFTLNSAHGTIVGVVPPGGQQRISSADGWNNLPALLGKTATSERPIVVGTAPFGAEPLLLSLQRVPDGIAPPPEPKVYAEVTAGKPAPAAKAAPLLPAFTPLELPQRFAEADRHFDALRNQVRIETPDPYLNAAAGALNIVADALWDSNAHAMMHGSIAWRTKLLGWRGPYSLDDLGWHDRAHENFETWLPHQNLSPVAAAIPAADPKANLARNEPALHSNGDLSNSHYDMNAVFIDALLRNLLWTGDRAFALEAWPAIKRHLAWERRLFRREYGKEKLPLYEAYASIWASDDLYYSGGGSAYQSAYNVFANRMAARIATLAGEDPKPYTAEADLIERAMRTLLWLPAEGTYAESKDLLGNQLVHPSSGLWNFYHTIDEGAATPKEAWQMAAALQSHFRPISVTGPGVPTDRDYHVYAETDWMPYSWSVNNVVMDENLHTALALWQSGHSDDACTLTKSALLASMFMGISPGNVGTMDYLDVYRREAQRDFGDGAGTLSRALVEGLFGIHPDALAGRLTLAPGFPADWDHARIMHPDVTFDFTRKQLADTYTITQPGARFRTLALRVSALYDSVDHVEVNGRPAPWHGDPEAAGRPGLVVETDGGPVTRITIQWKGNQMPEFSLLRVGTGAPQTSVAPTFTRINQGAFSWWAPSPQAPARGPSRLTTADWHTPNNGEAIAIPFNDKLTNLFAPGKYLAPRSPGVSLELPSQGAGAWAGHLKELPEIDDTGLRHVSAVNAGHLTLPNGISFTTPAAGDNVLFTSQWDNYPRQVTIPLSGQGAHLYLLMAGTTNFMQSRLDNGEVLVTYMDGTSSRLPLRNPETWWPIEQDYFIDDYQFPYNGNLPPRVDLKTGNVRLLDPATFKGQGRTIPGGAATVLDLKLDPSRKLQSFTVRTLANDVVIGLLAATLEPAHLNLSPLAK